jgi:hypothetical protein
MSADELSQFCGSDLYRSGSLTPKIFTGREQQDVHKENHVRLFPNPADNTIYIASESNLSSVRIFDVYGREVNILNPGHSTNPVPVDISMLNPGTYVAEIQTESRTERIKFIRL